jgi:hypothetical protein
VREIEWPDTFEVEERWPDELPLPASAAPVPAKDTKRFGFSKQVLPNRDVIIGFRFMRWAVARHYTYEQFWRLEREVIGTFGALLFAPFKLGCALLIILIIGGGLALLGLLLG